MSKLFATAIYGARERKPFVNLRHQDWVVQITPQEAREWALNILECSEAAEQDAFLVEFLAEKTEIPEDSAVFILKDYREWREKRTKMIRKEVVKND